MPYYKALHTLQHDSQVPENAIVNTFHFESAAPNGTLPEALQIIAKIRDFYDTIGTAGVKVMSLLSVNVQPNNARIKVYDMTDPVPREPIAEDVRTAGSEGSGGFPGEVALVLSFRSIAEPGVPLRRRRGRIYLGPLSDSATLISRSNGDVRPSQLAREALADAASRLATVAVAETVAWATRSTIDGVVKPVLEGFVDDAYDTQRRRGTKATTRTNWA